MELESILKVIYKISFMAATVDGLKEEEVRETINSTGWSDENKEIFYGLSDAIVSLIKKAENLNLYEDFDNINQKRYKNNYKTNLEEKRRMQYLAGIKKKNILNEDKNSDRPANISYQRQVGHSVDRERMYSDHKYDTNLERAQRNYDNMPGVEKSMDYFIPGRFDGKIFYKKHNKQCPLKAILPIHKPDSSNPSLGKLRFSELENLQSNILRTPVRESGKFRKKLREVAKREEKFIEVNWTGDDGNTVPGVLYYKTYINDFGESEVDSDSLRGTVEIDHPDNVIAKIDDDFINNHLLKDPNYRYEYMTDAQLNEDDWLSPASDEPRHDPDLYPNDWAFDEMSHADLPRTRRGPSDREW